MEKSYKKPSFSTLGGSGSQQAPQQSRSNAPRAQIYSSFIESEHQHSRNAYVSSKTRPDFKQSPAQTSRFMASNVIEPKRAKLDEKSLNERPNTFVDSAESKRTISLQQEFAKRYVGVNGFECENVFTDLLDENLLLVNLDSSKHGFCFKGTCSISLIYGHLQVNGFQMRALVDESSSILKWYSLYSPESNSFLTVLNKHEVNQVNEEEEAMTGEAESPIDLNLISRRIYLSLNLKRDFDAFDKSFKGFLQKFCIKSSSLFVLKAFNSQLCNYFGYFENFHSVYQATLSGIEFNRQKSSQVEEKLAQMGIFPISSELFNAIHVEQEEEKSIINKFSDKNVVPKIAACGGKDVGKSTLLRYLINSLLDKYPKVAYMDCDPGQCEFTLGGCLTLNFIDEPLLGPPHSHLNHSNSFCYALGHLSPNDVPGQYIQLLKQLFADYTNVTLNTKVPLICNTMGWNQGLGLCLLKETICLIKPTHIVQINHPVEANKNMPTLDKRWMRMADGWPSKPKSNRFEKQSPQSSFVSSSKSDDFQMEVDVPQQTDLVDGFDYELITLKSCAPYKTNVFKTKTPQKKYSPRDHRNLAIIAYFSRLQLSNSYFKPIHQIQPLKVSWSKLALHVSHVKVDYDQLLRVFNANLVSLCQVDPSYIKHPQDLNELPGYLDIPIGQPNQVPVLRCLGFGIVRGINIESKQFYILTPEPLEVLNKCNLLVKGMLSLPLEFFYEQDIETPCPYVKYLDPAQQLKTSSDTQNENEGANDHQMMMTMMCTSQPAQRKYLIHQQKQKPNPFQINQAQS